MIIFFECTDGWLIIRLKKITGYFFLQTMEVNAVL